jgi:hypothetical protein
MGLGSRRKNGVLRLMRAGQMYQRVKNKSDSRTPEETYAPESALWAGAAGEAVGADCAGADAGCAGVAAPGGIGI